MTARSGLVLALGLVAACADGHQAARAVPDTVPAVRAVPPEPPLLPTVDAVAVTRWTGPGEQPFEVTSRLSESSAHLHRRTGQVTFPLPLRVGAPTLVNYPCASCHQGARVTGRQADSAHRNIRGVHPELAGAACAACHVSTAVDRLALSGGETTTLDHAYRLCAQCHFSQVNDWAMGAHGKRLDSWGGRRVVMNCADCHDPHRPATEPRTPFPGPRMTRRR